MHLAASPLSAARPLAPYLRIATQRPSPPTQPQARPRTAAALRPHGLHTSVDRKHSPAAIQPKTPGRGWRPAACTATPALLGQCRGKGRACGRGDRPPHAAPLDWMQGGGLPNNCDGRAVGAGVGPSPGIVPPPCPPSRAGRCAVALLRRPAPTLAARCAASTPAREPGRLLRARNPSSLNGMDKFRHK